MKNGKGPKFGARRGSDIKHPRARGIDLDKIKCMGPRCDMDIERRSPDHNSRRDV